MIFVQGVNFPELCQQEMFNFRKDKELRHQIERAINNGLDVGLDKNEAVFVRQNAYLLIMGIRIDKIKTSQRQKYESLLQQSKQKAEEHVRLADKCPCKTNKHFGCHVLTQIKKDVPRTMGAFTLNSEH